MNLLRTLIPLSFHRHLPVLAAVCLAVCLILAALPSRACVLREALNPKVPLLILPKAKPSSWEQENYYHGLLRQILQRTEEEYGACELAQTEEMLTRMRSAALIDRNQGVDLFWATTTIERENLLHPIRIPLLKGLMKHKVFLIHADDQAKFSAVKNLEDLQELRAGQGADWPDTAIFLVNGIDVVTSTNYESLYKMLAAKRFDFFPRGSNQILSELRHNADKNIVVERELVLVYPAPVYFFVDSKNLQLAQRIEKGLRAMVQDGSFDRYFNNHPLIVEALTELNLNERRAIYIHNPLLPEGASLEKNEIWMKRFAQ
jgi:ABC-type amino acid transport substrate-binding protein